MLPRLRKYEALRVKKKMEKLADEIDEIVSASQTPIELGNIRKGKTWGSHKEDKLIFFFELDFITNRPLTYKIEYDINSKTFSCYAKMGIMNAANSILKFSTQKTKALQEKLLKLVQHIPQLRERMLKEYVYFLSGNSPHRKWRNFFRRSSNKQGYIKSVIAQFFDENKISLNEKKRLYEYSETL